MKITSQTTNQEIEEYVVEPLFEIQNADSKQNLKVKYGTSYSVFDIIEGEQTQQLDLPFEINGRFPFMEKKCSCCDDVQIMILSVYEDDNFGIIVDKNDVEFTTLYEAS